ncbi:dTMP kinase [Citricoccus parietis]|uniref:dTMP kinase n=2 Tax=Citricoccus parietis TaxID=592307 RepID=A0ABV5G729_9MICC
MPWLSAKLLQTVTVAVLDVPAETAQERILARGEDHETLEYLGAARAAYLDLARSRGWLVVDATGTPEAIVAQLMDAAASGQPRNALQPVARAGHGAAARGPCDSFPGRASSGRR